MRTVIDMHAGRSIIVGATPPAGLARGFMHGNGSSSLRQTDGSGKAGKSGADDVYLSWHQTIAYRKTAHSRWTRSTRTRSLGAANPRCCNRSSMGAYASAMM